MTEGPQPQGDWLQKQGRYVLPQSQATQILTDIHQALQVSSVQSCPTLCNPMNRSTPGLPVHHQLSEFTQTHVH